MPARSTPRRTRRTSRIRNAAPVRNTRGRRAMPPRAAISSRARACRQPAGARSGRRSPAPKPYVDSTRARAARSGSLAWVVEFRPSHGTARYFAPQCLIRSRSRKYLWRIGTHRHTLLSQCVLVTAGPVSVTLDDTRAALSGPAVMIIPAGTVHSFRFRADTLGSVLTVDLARVLSMASAAHQWPIETLFSMPRAIDLRKDPQLALRAAQLLERLAHEFAQPD